MHSRGPLKLITSHPRASAVPSPRRSPGALLTVVGLLGIAGALGVACGDKDTTDVIPQGGSGGSAGSAGRGGTAGTAGTAGRGGTAGTAGTAGTGGTAGELPDAGEPPDANVPPDAGPDSGDGGNGDPPPPDPRQVRAEALCQLKEDVPSCPSPSETPVTCVQGMLEAQGAADFLPPDCTDEIIDFYQCLVDQGVGAFICRDNVPDYRLDALMLGENSLCPTEEAAWLAAQGADCPAD
jgi:hypothetical protein